ncbi:MAG TPA: cupin domain-containing protein [Flavobacteriales bacterium]|nr:cupin domain-containing protein [Flavobacteriales bacterium]
MESSMIKLIFSIIIAGLCSVYVAQTNDVEDLTPDSTDYDNLYIKKLSSDSLSTSFAIWIKLKVKLHKHDFHTEHVYVLEGSGDFTLGNTTQPIKKGDLITIPKNTWHGVEVTSKVPLKVVSIQSPEFKGIDRVFKSHN